MTSLPPEDRVTVQDVVDAGHCAWGIRKWFTELDGSLPAGVTFRGFMKHGMSVAEARSINDALMNRIVDLKEARRGE